MELVRCMFPSKPSFECRDLDKLPLFAPAMAHTLVHHVHFRLRKSEMYMELA